MNFDDAFNFSLKTIRSFGLLMLFFANSACFIKSNIDEGLAAEDPTVDGSIPVVQFQSASQFASESVGTATITVVQDVASSTATVVTFSLLGTATGSGTDYSLSGSTITIPAGQLSASLTVTIVNDALLESDETVIVTLANPTNAVLGTRAVHTLNITTSCDPSITTSYGGGLGSSASPYTICNLDQWNYFASDSGNWNRYFRLESNLDFNGVTLTDFKMIGNTTTAFTGKFDGNSKTIRNVSLNGASDVGLFLKTDGSVEISNLTLQDFTISTSGRVGSLVTNHGTTGSLTLTGIVANNISIPSAAHQSGGLVGVSGAPFIADQITLATVTFAGNGRYAGGLIGVCLSTCTVSNLTGSAITRSTAATGDYTSGIVSTSIGDLTVTDVSLTTLSLQNLYSAGVSSATEGNVSLTRVKVAGSILSNGNSGGLIRSSQGFTPVSLSIVDSSFDGTVYGGGGAGGLVFYFDGDISISKSFVKGSVYTASNTAGGLVDFAAPSGGKNVVISDSYVTATVAATAGGSYSSGLIHSAMNSNVTISRSYFSGAMGAQGTRSCIMHSADIVATKTFNDVYYDSTLCTHVHSGAVGSLTGVTGLATGTFQSATPYTNWLPAVWTFASGANPKLAREP